MIDIERYDDVTRVRLASVGGWLAGFDVSCYLLRDVLVDSGFPRARKAIQRLLRERRIVGAMLTHYHEDHAGNVELLAAHGIPLALPALTETRLREPADLLAYRRIVWGTPIPLRSNVRAYAPTTLQLVPTPGHSADHHVVWDPDTETVFSGDLWLGVHSRLMHINEDPFEILRSIRLVIGLAPKRMFDAHRGLVDDPVGALTARATWLEDTIAQVGRALEAGWSTRAIVREILEGEEIVATLSRGEYARRNLVDAIARQRRVR
jgi:glyoxylase-like metal-dependent hydrolase (beta-lactamase superfamily II)